MAKGVSKQKKEAKKPKKEKPKKDPKSVAMAAAVSIQGKGVKN